MLKDHEKLKIPDLNKRHEMVWEVNWNPTDINTNECQVVKVIFPNGDTQMVKREHLMSALFAIGTSEQQRDITPKVVNRSRWYETIVSVVAKSNIRKGEKITFPLKLTLPTVSEEIIAETKRELAKGGLNKLQSY